MGARNRMWRWLLLGVLGLVMGRMVAQDKPAVPPPAADAEPPQEPVSEQPIHTLHVYMDLIQVPVLVLDSEMERMKPIDASKFFVSLDSGPEFHPKHVRQQGDDPITLGILLDVNSQSDSMVQIGKAIAGLAPASLHPRDHVTLYTLDCTLVRTLDDVPADPAVLKGGVDHALEKWIARRKEKHPAPCAKKVGLWDAMGAAVKELGDLPGRRTLLAITDDNDSGSTTQWDSLRMYSQVKGVAIFGYGPRRGHTSISSADLNDGSRGRRMSGMTAIQTTTTFSESAEDEFRVICERSGGMLIVADAQFASRQLARFATTLRERYILEFSRPRNDEPGEHGILVTVAKQPRAYIRPAGVSILLADRGENDPDTIPRDASDAPEIGNRKVLKKPD